MTTLALALRQVRYENRAFWRNPVAAFFTFAFPLIFLLIFSLLFGNDEIEVRGGTAHLMTFYVPAIATWGVVNACYTNLAMMVSMARDQGLLKRVRGTPLPAWAFLFGRLAHVSLVAVLLVAVMTTAGAVFFDVEVPTRTLPAFLLAIAVGAAAFCALGLAVTGLIPNADAAPAVVNASILPLLFISDVFVRVQDAPAWLATVGDIFPVKHLSISLQTAFNPFEQGSGLEPAHLAILGVWGVAALLVAVRTFSWEPRV